MKNNDPVAFNIQRSEISLAEFVKYLHEEKSQSQPESSAFEALDYLEDQYLKVIEASKRALQHLLRPEEPSPATGSH